MSLFFLDAVQRQMEEAVGQPVSDLSLKGLFWGQDTAAIVHLSNWNGGGLPKLGKKEVFK